MSDAPTNAGGIDLLSLKSLLSHRKRWEPPKLELAALHGPAGEWALASQPFTEASVVGVLLSSLVGFGNAIGGTPHVTVGVTHHRSNEYALLIGPTATGRKGDAMRVGLRVVELADSSWSKRVERGFGSGEAIVDAVRDPVIEVDDDGAEKIVLSAATDKRLQLHEPELAHVLAIAARDGSTTGSLLRLAWDGDRLENRTKHRTVIATGAHVSFLAAITPDELRRRIPETDVANGFLNRFLLIAVTRSKHLPEAPPLPSTLAEEHASAFAKALTQARRVGALERDDEARELWKHAYEHELAVDRDGLAGAACSRAEAHALRLSILYALLDRSRRITVEHVNAALAVWRYVEATALLVFGTRLGDPDAETVIAALEDAWPDPLTRSDVRDLFGRHRTANDIDLALERLLAADRITVGQEASGGRPTTLIRLVRQQEFCSAT
jgi:hypothetical protein